MATYLDLALNRGVGIGDRLSFPLGNPGDEGYDTRKRHEAIIVGPRSFPNCDVVYLAPPSPTQGNTSIYNPESNRLRSDWERTPEGGIVKKLPDKQEMVVQTIHVGFSLFERA